MLPGHGILSSLCCLTCILMKKWLLGRGRSSATNGLFPGGWVVSVGTSFSCCCVNLCVPWLASWQVEQAGGLHIFLWIKCQGWLGDNDLPALNVPCIVWRKAERRLPAFLFFFFLPFLTGLSFSPCYWEGLHRVALYASLYSPQPSTKWLCCSKWL